MSDLSLCYYFLQQFISSKCRGTPYKINFVLTNRCNSKCITCRIWEKHNTIESGSHTEMDLDEIQLVLQRLPASITWLSLTGGEPFLRNDLDEILSTALKEMPQLTLLTIITNGLCEDKILRITTRFRHIRNVQILLTFSLDGPAYLHNRIRGLPDGYQRTWQTYEKVRHLVKDNKGFRVLLETTISSWNIGSINSFLHRLINSNHNVFITLAHNADFYHNRGVSVAPALNEDLLRIIRYVDETLCWYKLDDALRRIYLRWIPFYLNPKQKYRFPCSALKSSITIHPDGLITPCLMWSKELIQLRKENYDLASAWKNLKLNAIRNEIRSGGCPGCWTPCEAFQSIIDNCFKTPTWRWLLTKK